jgi:hypothetical protein
MQVRILSAPPYNALRSIGSTVPPVVRRAGILDIV